ncbi:MAG: hypothetical protein IKP79_02975 [Bacilli bacterium]|nr:hypothetical protein [Bacilli bacterium]
MAMPDLHCFDGGLNPNEYVAKKYDECIKLIEYIDTIYDLEYASNDNVKFKAALDFESIINCLDLENGVGSDEKVFDKDESFISCRVDKLITILKKKIDAIRYASDFVFPEMDCGVSELENEYKELLRIPDFYFDLVHHLEALDAMDTFGKKIFYSDMPVSIAANFLYNVIENGNCWLSDLEKPDKRFNKEGFKNYAYRLRCYFDNNKDVKKDIFDLAQFSDISDLKELGFVIFDEPEYLGELLEKNNFVFDSKLSKHVSTIINGEKFKELSEEEKSHLYGNLLDNLSQKSGVNEGLTSCVDFPDINLKYVLDIIEEYIDEGIPSPEIFAHIIYVAINKCKDVEELKNLLGLISDAINSLNYDKTDAAEKKHVLTFAAGMLNDMIKDESRQ